MHISYGLWHGVPFTFGCSLGKSIALNTRPKFLKCNSDVSSGKECVIIQREYLAVCLLTMKHTRWVSLNARQEKSRVHSVDTTRVCFIVNEHATKFCWFNHICILKTHKLYSFMWLNIYRVSFQSWELMLQFVSWWLMKFNETIYYCGLPILMNWSLWLRNTVKP